MSNAHSEKCILTSAEFAPPQYQKVLSYASGWMSTLGWLASVASSVFVVTTQIQAMIEVTNPDYAFTSWQYTLIMLAFVVITIMFNTWGAGVLPTLEIVSLVGHIAGFIITIVPLLVLCPKNTAYEVFVDFENDSGYSMGAAYLLSQVTIIYCVSNHDSLYKLFLLTCRKNLGSDSVVHISEEVNDASITVPRCMWWSYVGNVALGIVMLIVMLFCIGPLDAVVSASTMIMPSKVLIILQLESDVPYLLLFNQTGSTTISLVLNIILFLLIYSGNVTALATAAREMWAFARDRGLPFSSWTGRM